MITSVKVTPCDSDMGDFRMSEEIQFQSDSVKQEKKNEEMPKKKIHWVVFWLNILGMLMGCFQIIIHIFELASSPNRAIVAGSIVTYNILVICPTILHLTTLKTIFQQIFLLDTVLLATSVAIVTFVNMIVMFDRGQGNVYLKIVEFSFSFQLLLYSSITKVMLLCLDWKRWQLIWFKLHLMANALMFFIIGVYFIIIDFTYSKHIFKRFDAKVHDFMLMFIFAMFSCLYEYYNKVTDLDYTGMLKYVYRIKNVDQKHQIKKRLVIERQIKSIREILSRHDLGRSDSGTEVISCKPTTR